MKELILHYASEVLDGAEVCYGVDKVITVDGAIDLVESLTYVSIDSVKDAIKSGLLSDYEYWYAKIILDTGCEIESKHIAIRDATIGVSLHLGLWYSVMIKAVVLAQISEHINDIERLNEGEQ